MYEYLVAVFEVSSICSGIFGRRGLLCRYEREGVGRRRLMSFLVEWMGMPIDEEVCPPVMDDVMMYHIRCRVNVGALNESFIFVIRSFRLSHW